LRDPDGVEDVRQDGFFRLTGEADLGTLGQTLALSMGYRQGNITMSPKCLHGGYLTKLDLRKNAVDCGLPFALIAASDPSLSILGMETSWRHHERSKNETRAARLNKWTK
jgi:hypothetical protein